MEVRQKNETEEDEHEEQSSRKMESPTVISISEDELNSGEFEGNKTTPVEMGRRTAKNIASTRYHPNIGKVKEVEVMSEVGENTVSIDE